MSDYKDPLHVTFDESEVPVSLHCLRCHAAVATRAEVPSKVNPTMMVHVLLKGSNYREREVTLSDGSACYLPHCTDCVNAPLDKAEAMAIVKRTWKRAMENAGRPAESVKRHHARVKDLKISKEEGVHDAR